MSNSDETNVSPPEINRRKYVKKSVSEVNLTFNLKYNSNEQHPRTQTNTETKINRIINFLNQFMSLFRMGFENKQNLEFEVTTSYKKSELNLTHPTNQENGCYKKTVEKQEMSSHDCEDSFDSRESNLILELNNDLYNKVISLNFNLNIN